MTSPHNDAAEGEQDLFFNIINRFVGLHSREAMRATRNEPGREYPFVAMDPRQVLAQLRAAAESLGLTPDAEWEGRPRLLDVGCGIGNVLLFAEQLGFEVYGIEKDDYPYRIAARLFEERIEQADIWTYDRYGEFEVIYYFRPFCDREPQLRFEKMIEDRLKPGGLLIANHKNSDAIESDPRFRRLAPGLPVWEKKAPS
ncbi:MAG: class I SAM-dependent methyltransferase [Desulfobacteraceae bacterium]|nr:class I SAM-dependent methyltransferase [Desulfobacteraceae bacterium]